MKEFGIYTNDENISVITNITDTSVYGFEFSLEGCENVEKNLSNKHINNWIELNTVFFDECVFLVNIIGNPDYFKDYGYVGQLTNNNVKLKMIEVLDDLDIY